MSRFHDDDGDGDGMPWEMWHQTVENAIKGKRGQAILRELKEAFLALPQPRLIEGSIVREGEVCALGALAAQRLKSGPLPLRFINCYSQVETLKELEEQFGEYLNDEFGTVEFGQEMGLKRALAWAISHENDEGSWDKETPERRYQRMLHWVDQQLISSPT